MGRCGYTHYETHKYVAWCFRDHFGDGVGSLRLVDIPFNEEGELDFQYPDDDIVDMDMEEIFSFDGEPEVGDEHKELRGLDFEPVVVDPASSRWLRRQQTR